jgi:hypothetical protein
MTKLNEDEPQPKMKRVLVFTPVLRSMTIDLNNTMGGRLAEIFHRRNIETFTQGKKASMNKMQHKEFVDGLNWAGVFGADRLLKFIEISDCVEIELKEVEDK